MPPSAGLAAIMKRYRQAARNPSQGAVVQQMQFQAYGGAPFMGVWWGGLPLCVCLLASGCVMVGELLF